jgi:hypothetical protein
MALVKYNNNSISAVTSAASIPSGALVPIKTLTASSSATLSFVNGSDGVVLDSTYPIYKFVFINCHPATDDVDFSFNLSTDSGSNYNVTKTTTFFAAGHNESGTDGFLTYAANNDLAQSTAFQMLTDGVGNSNDESCSGELFLFNPSSSVFVKHFIAKNNRYYFGDYSILDFLAGYGNTTSPINAVQFKFSSGNTDSGTIKLYGIKDS